MRSDYTAALSILREERKYLRSQMETEADLPGYVRMLGVSLAQIDAAIERLTTDLRVVVEVYEGTAEAVELPPGVVVEVRDFDWQFEDLEDAEPVMDLTSGVSFKKTVFGES